MKQIFTLCCLLAASIMYAQNSNVGIGTTTPNPAAALDITATGKGLLIPRMDSVTRVAITTPPDGLMVFQNDGRKGFWYAIGGNWLYIPDKTASGDNLGNHTATQNVVLNSNDIQLRSSADSNHGIGWYGNSGSAKNWAGQNIDGPVLYGYLGGVLGTTNGGKKSILKWTKDGNVGISTNGPAQLLHLGSTIYPKPAMIRYEAGSGTGVYSQWETGINVNSGNPADQSGDNYDFAVRDVTVGAARMLIEHGTGRTGIGTIAPLMQLHVSKADSAVALFENQQNLDLNVKTGLYFKTGSDFYPYTGAIQTIGGGNDIARLGFFTYTSPSPDGLLERLSISDDGNVGIGITAPSQKLDVNGTVQATNYLGDGTSLTGVAPVNNPTFTGRAVFDAGTIADGTLSTTMRLGGPNVGEGIVWKTTAGGNQYGLDLFTGGLSRLSINNNGKVGIGTTTPYSQFANTAVNTIGSDGNGGNAGSLDWSASQNGYVGQFFNGSTVGNANGLAIKVASTTSTALDISQQASQTTTGASLFKVKANGDVSYSGNLNMGVQYINYQFTADAHSYYEAFAGCPTGTKLIGGGGGHRDFNSAQQDIQVNFSGPDTATNRWRMLIDNTGGSGRAIIVYAICAKVQ